MKRGKKILALFLIITMLLPFVMNIPAEAAEKSKQLDVLVTHDTHSHLNRLFNNCRWRTERSRRICEAKDSD